MKAIESQGITIGMSDGSMSPITYNDIGNITSFTGPGGQASVIDVTNLDSTAKEKLMGLPDEGQFSIDINLDPDNTQHQALRTARANRALTYFKITLTDTSPATAITFQGYVLGFSINGSVDQVVKATVTIEVDGPVSYA